METSNIEFFHSESSFGSSSAMSNSRVQDLADQLTDDADAIFLSLRSTLVPREDLLDKN